MDQLGFRFQRVHPFAADGDHLYVWLDGDVQAARPSVTATAEDLAEVLPEVRDAARSFRTQSDASYYADNVRVLERRTCAARLPSRAPASAVTRPPGAPAAA